jgi:hypothetical protein
MKSPNSYTQICTTSPITWQEQHYKLFPKEKITTNGLEGYFIDQQHTFINQRQKKSHDQISNNFICLDKDEWKKLQNDLQSTENEKKPTLHSDH